MTAVVEGCIFYLSRGIVHNSCEYLQKTFDIGAEMCYHIVVQGSDEDTPRRMPLREEPIWCDGSAEGNRRIPLLSR